MTFEDQDTADHHTPERSKMVIRVPSRDNDDAAITQITERGGVPLLVGDNILAEVAGTELHEAIQATAFLNSAEILKISGDLVENLSEALNSDAQDEDLAEVAANAASLFVLCLRRYNILDIADIPACGVTFNGDDNEVRLQLTA